MKKYLILALLFISAIHVSAQSWLRPDSRVPYRNVNGKLIVDVEINGKVRPFLFDTGAGSTCITDSLYAELGLDSIRTLRVSDSSGKQGRQIVARGDTLRMGGWTITNLPILVLNSDYLLYECFGIDGIIGSDILQNRAVRFESRDSVIRLAGDASAFGLEKREGVKVILQGTRPFIRTTFEHERKRTSQLVLFDSGASGFSINTPAFQVLDRKGVVADKEEGIGRRSYGVHGIEEERVQYRGIVPRFRIGAEALEQVPVGTTSSRNSLLGSFLLKYGDVTIDYGQKRFYYEVFADPEDRKLEPWFAPINRVYVGDQMLVGVVWDDALKGIVRSGDRIVAINGRPTEEYDKCHSFTGGFTPEEGAVVRIETQSGNVIEVIVIEKEE